MLEDCQPVCGIGYTHRYSQPCTRPASRFFTDDRAVIPVCRYHVATAVRRGMIPSAT